MDYSSSSSSIFVLSLVILFCSIESSSAQYTYSPFYGKVSLALHYESLCPYCSNFMVNYLPQIFSNGLVDIIDLKLIPHVV
ncbi:hypothetical protein C5167_025433 [Papaver somniferum]|uniref:Uncharacterized protein n=1 Tax=Papaver somniferum TaxID=3469 RepID=A0A4Y7JVE2_PAPSO|nr:hypothetical protein C5167_025433 [Papaver somniferum]